MGEHIPAFQDGKGGNGKTTDAAALAGAIRNIRSGLKLELGLCAKILMTAGSSLWIVQLREA
jgi:hypothetical protein